MIIKMTKYSMLLLSADMDSFLAGIQNIGMVDITRSAVAIDDSSRDVVEKIASSKEMAKKLAEFRKSNPELVAGASAATSVPEGEALLNAMTKAFARKDEIAGTLGSLRMDYNSALPWGEFNRTDLDKIAMAGLVPHFYAVPDKAFRPEWEEQYPLYLLNTIAGRTYFTVLSVQGEDYRFPVSTEEKLPETNCAVLASKIKELEAETEALNAEIAVYTLHIDDLNGYAEKIGEGLDLYLAKAASIKEGEGTICLMEGFAPSADDDKVKAYLDGSPAYYIAEAAKGEDNPPVKLKNNRFSKLFEPIGGLYELPSYDEPDLTPYFAPFYMLFFGCCLGDMGYGLILLLTGIAASIFMPKFSAYGKLVAWLGFGSILMPLLSGTFFGMKVYDIVQMPDNIKALFFSDLKMFWFSIIFGIFQIIFARMLKAIFAFGRKDWDTGLTEVGWSLVIIWLTCAYAGSQMGTTLLPKMVSMPMIIVGLALVLFCSKPSKNFFLRPLKGVISLYDVTGIFGDVLSYIRLFGLGTTGGILALVINSIALSMSGLPYVGWVLTVIVLIFGHLAVMGLSCLGAFVHPIRLTFVEFYKNSGFQGGGRAYKPMKLTNKQ